MSGPSQTPRRGKECWAKDGQSTSGIMGSVQRRQESLLIFFSLLHNETATGPEMPQELFHTEETKVYPITLLPQGALMTE